MSVIALDIGGTKIAAAIVKNNKVVKKIILPTKKNVNEFLQEIRYAIEILIPKNLEGIGLGVPGPVDVKKGILVSPPNLPFKNLKLKEHLKKHYKTKIVVENDANCAAFGESIYWKCKNLVCLTLGTGLGSGVVIDGKLYSGEGYAAEIGHMVINFNGPKCHCGNYGCLEEYVSTRALLRIAKKRYRKISIKEFIKRYDKGEKKAIACIEELGYYLGIGLANIVNIFNPEIIVLSGGISKFGKPLVNAAIKEMKARAFKVMQKNLRVVISKLREDAALIGLANLIRKQK